MTDQQLKRNTYRRLKAGLPVTPEQLLDTGMTAVEFAAATRIGALVDEDGHIVELVAGVPTAKLKVRLGRL